LLAGKEQRQSLDGFLGCTSQPVVLPEAWSPTVDGKTLTPQQFGAFVFQKLKRDAEEFLGETVSKAVITVPALYSERRRQATSEAATIAGLEVVRMVHEPTAIAAVFGEQIAAEGSTYVLVVNLGGGAFDVSLMALEDGVIEVKVTSGDDSLGAEDWNTVIVDWLVQKFRRGHGIDLSLDPLAAERLREAVEQAKVELSSASETTIDLPYLATSGHLPLHLTETLNRARFEQLTKGLLDRCHGVLKVAFADANAVVADLGGKIERVVLAGGGSRMPGFADMVRMAVPGVQTRLRPSTRR
jgi:molecular chaperone DnaK